MIEYTLTDERKYRSDTITEVTFGNISDIVHYLLRKKLGLPNGKRALNYADYRIIPDSTEISGIIFGALHACWDMLLSKRYRVFQDVSTDKNYIYNTQGANFTEIGKDYRLLDGKGTDKDIALEALARELAGKAPAVK